MQNSFQQKLLALSVSFFGLGFSPKAPGTVGTLGAVGLGYFYLQSSWLVQGVLCLLLSILGIILSQAYENQKGEHDLPEIVIDEVVGYLITCFMLPFSWKSLILAFIIFRILDIWKPLLIGVADRKLKGGLGVMADDMIAGIVGNFILHSLIEYGQLQL